jgi:hypothetical protein
METGREVAISYTISKDVAEVDRLMELAVAQTWTRTQFRQQRADLGRMAADYLRLARSLAGLPDVELPSIWTWDASGTAAGPPDGEISSS